MASISTLPIKSYAQNDTEVVARNLFNDGNFSQALAYFKDLQQLYPNDAMINYYYAVCLVETKQFTEATRQALQNASGDQVPAKIYYYRGQYQHANGQLDVAMALYQQFMDLAKRKDVKGTRVDELLDLCKQQINPFPQPVVEKQAPAKTPKPEKPQVDEIPEDLINSTINFQVTPEIKYMNINQFKERSSAQSFIQGRLLEKEIEKNLTKANSLRKKYDSAPEDAQKSLADTIIQLEKETYALNQQVNHSYTKAREKEIAYWNQATEEKIDEFKQAIQQMEDSIHAANSIVANENESTKILKLPETAIDEIIQDATPEATDQIVYKIQIGAYKDDPPNWVQKLFKKLSVIRRIDQYTDEDGVTVYTVGELNSYEDAMQMQSQVRLEGVKDAFIAAYKDGERISIKEARNNQM